MVFIYLCNPIPPLPRIIEVLMYLECFEKCSKKTRDIEPDKNKLMNNL